MTVFADTSALYALLDRDDDGHTRAADAFTGLIDRERLVTHNYVLVETEALLRRRMGGRVSERFRGDVVPAMAVEWIDERLHRQAEGNLARGRGQPSLVDLVSFEMMSEQGIEQAFALDHHFVKAGFDVVPA